MRIKFLSIVVLAVFVTVGAALISRAGETVSIEEMLATDLALEFDTDQEMVMPEMVDYSVWFMGGTTVHFDHALHAEDATGCGRCHHTESCSGCHRAEENSVPVINKRIAFHEACFRCHEQEPGGGGCADCHVQSPEGTAHTGVADSDALGTMGQDKLISVLEAALPEMDLISEKRRVDREASMPDVRRYLTKYEGTTMVVFSHQEHIEEYELSCGACHHIQECKLCHVGFRRQLRPDAREDAIHANCQGCHEEIGAPTECDECHRPIEAR